jgi:dTDP-4-dehydrorhamnose 3,5-epimerase-like enzyme
LLKNSSSLGPILFELSKFEDQRGSLVIGELGNQLPFSAERFFFISDVPEGEPRGIHAHKECHQFLICVKGSVKAMVDNGIVREVIHLNRSNLGLHMPPLTWGAQYDYSPDAVLLVLASHQYDADDYIHDYEEFMSLVTSKDLN